MASPFLTAFNTIRNFWNNITLSQRVFVGGLATVLVAVFIGLMIWASRPEYSLLYSNLSAEDANRVIKALETQQVPYALEENGTAIMVPADRVHSTRIRIAGENVLTGQGIGFEIFNDAKFGQTDFVQKVNYRRALEGELARTIAEFPGVESARVHLVIPQRSLFIEEQQNPSASVLLKLAAGRSMESKDVQAVVNLVTMAVAGLDKERVSIADSSGKVLFQPEKSGSLFGMNQTQIEQKLALQQNLERRIEELLMPIIGAGRVMAKVNADMDFSHKTIRKEIFDPEKTVVRSEMRSEESGTNRATITGGVPDPNFRGDGPNNNLSNAENTSEKRTTNFEINKETQDIVTSAGSVSRLTVAVVVDGAYEKGADGTTTFVPRKDEELRRIRQLVANAVGFDQTRGDTIEVSNFAFSGVDMGDDSSSSIASIIADYALRFGKPLLNALLVFLFLVLVLRPVILALIRPKVEGRVIEELAGLPQTDERLALVEADEDTAAATAILEKIEDIKAHSIQLSEQNMEQAIGIIKSWLRAPAENLPARAA